MIRLVWLALAAALLAAPAAAIFWVLNGRLGETDARVIGSVVGVFMTLAIGAACLRLFETEINVPLAAIALAAVPPLLAAFVFGVWKGEFGDGSNEEFKWLPTAFSWTVVGLVATTVPLLVRNPRMRALLVPAVALCGIAAAAIATAMIWADVDDESWGKALACLAIAMGGFWLAAPAIERGLSRSQWRGRPSSAGGT